MNPVCFLAVIWQLDRKTLQTFTVIVSGSEIIVGIASNTQFNRSASCSY